MIFHERKVGKKHMAWKEIKGYEGRYMVSDTGKIMSMPRTIKTSRGYRTISKKRILKCSKLRNGTTVIRLVDNDGNKQHYTVAQIVARTFIEHDDPKRTFVRHIDGKEGNNNVKNLKWDYQGRAASTDYRFKRRKKIQESKYRPDSSIQKQRLLRRISNGYGSGTTFRLQEYRRNLSLFEGKEEDGRGDGGEAERRELILLDGMIYDRALEVKV